MRIYNVSRWTATGIRGVYWDGGEYPVASGPRWYVHLRAKLHLFAHPYRAVRIERISY